MADVEQAKRLRSEVLRMVRRKMLQREAEASVALDRDGDVHTCYDGHCKAGTEAIRRHRAAKEQAE